MEQSRIRIVDIAQMLGLSTATVSNVLHSPSACCGAKPWVERSQQAEQIPSNRKNAEMPTPLRTSQTSGHSFSHISDFLLQSRIPIRCFKFLKTVKLPKIRP